MGGVVFVGGGGGGGFSCREVIRWLEIEFRGRFVGLRLSLMMDGW